MLLAETIAVQAVPRHPAQGPRRTLLQRCVDATGLPSDSEDLLAAAVYSDVIDLAVALLAVDDPAIWAETVDTLIP